MKYGVYTGRFQPIHLGHQKIIDTMIKNHGIDNVLLVLGSVGSLNSEKNPLNYTERKYLIKKLYPSINIVGIADVQTDDEWIDLLQDLINAKFGIGFNDVLFYGGSLEDTRYYEFRNLNCKIIDRFVGKYGNISASIVRNRILKLEDLFGYVDKNIIEDVKKMFRII